MQRLERWRQENAEYQRSILQGVDRGRRMWEVESGVQQDAAQPLQEARGRQEAPESPPAPSAAMSPVKQGGPLEGLAFWCDSDPNVAASASTLRAGGLQVRSFTEPEALLEAYKATPAGVVCVLSSMMEGGGRKQRGAMNAYGLFAAICAEAQARGLEERPVLGVISLSADERAAKAAGADFVMHGDRTKAQRLVVSTLRRRLGLQGGFRAT